MPSLYLSKPVPSVDCLGLLDNDEQVKSYRSHEVSFVEVRPGMFGSNMHNARGDVRQQKSSLRHAQNS
eukprot:5117612-Amphidinium_carterae.1